MIFDTIKHDETKKNQTQNLVLAREWGFDPLRRYHNRISMLWVFKTRVPVKHESILGPLWGHLMSSQIWDL